MNRGINSTILLKPSANFSLDAVTQVYEDVYGNERYVKVLPAGKLPDTKHVFMTNCCEIGYAYDKHTGKLVVCSCIDNLAKGASGQAVQAMNIRFGISESAGLD
jgi:N-acetyl-gamma-glutamyl-phosphate reductase